MLGFLGNNFGLLLRNNCIVRHCYIPLVTQQTKQIRYYGYGVVI
jgi:hypothetical protein